jgi:thiol-disulfide isomerase/thioredoxin
MSTPIAILLRMMLVALLIAVQAACAFASNSVSINVDNFDQVTAGKNVFIKFFESSCEFCQKIAPEWEKLAGEWKDHPRVLIGEVDCRANIASENWCHDEMEIFGLPTLLFGEPSYGGSLLQSYGGDKTFEALSTFVNETLSQKPICSPGNLEACEPDVKQNLESFWRLSTSELEAQIAAKEQVIDDAHLNFKKEFDRMQAIYDKSAHEHETTTAEVKVNIKILQSIVDTKKRKG